MNIFSRLKNVLREWEWTAYKKRRRARLKVTDFSILSTNCIGGIIYHDLGLEFRTPTVNFSIPIRDLLKLVERPQWYMDQPLVEIPVPNPSPKVLLGAMLGDLRVNFMHYNNFQEAAEKCEERKRKINWDRIILVATDRANCDYETIRRFDRLPWPNKIIFTRLPYPEFPSACHIPGFEAQEELGILTDFKPGFWKRRFLDDFDYVAFLNRTQ